MPNYKPYTPDDKRYNMFEAKKTDLSQQNWNSPKNENENKKYKSCDRFGDEYPL